MSRTEQIDRLHHTIRERDKECLYLLNILQYDPPADAAELFRLKRRFILLSREKSKLIEESKNLSK